MHHGNLSSVMIYRTNRAVRAGLFSTQREKVAGGREGGREKEKEKRGRERGRDREKGLSLIHI